MEDRIRRIWRELHDLKVQQSEDRAWLSERLEQQRNRLLENGGQMRLVGDRVRVVADKVEESCTELAAMRGSFGQIEHSVSEMQGSVDDVKTSIGEMQDSVVAMQSSLGEVQGSVVAMQSSLGEVQSGMSRLQSGISGLGTRMARVEGGLGRLEQSLGEVRVGLSELADSLQLSSQFLIDYATESNQVEQMRRTQDDALSNLLELYGQLLEELDQRLSALEKKSA